MFVITGFSKPIADYVVALEVSGEAVEAEFERRLRQIVSPRDYNGDLERLIYQICREFKEEKKNCGQPPRPGSPSWNIHTPRLRANPRKGFEKDCMKLSRYTPPGLLQGRLAKTKQNNTGEVF